MFTRSICEIELAKSADTHTHSLFVVCISGTLWIETKNVFGGSFASLPLCEYLIAN